MSQDGPAWQRVAKTRFDNLDRRDTQVTEEVSLGNCTMSLASEADAVRYISYPYSSKVLLVIPFEKQNRYIILHVLSHKNG